MNKELSEKDKINTYMYVYMCVCIYIYNLFVRTPCVCMYGPGGSVGKESACQAGDAALIPES